MIRFNDIVVHEKEGTVEIGAGLTWTSVYSYLVPRGLNVVGGRLDGVGVGGFTLGGGQRYSAFFAHIVPHYNSPVCLMDATGYSWKTNQYGLTVDTLTAIELVLPNGKVVKVTEKNKDLWFALKVSLTSI